MSLKIVLFNGPPKSGKDTIAGMLAIKYLGAHLVKFATPLKEVAKHLYCGGDSALFHQLDSPELKDQEHYRFFGKTCRQVQIAISETFMKPLHGQYVFGKILAQTIATEYEKHPDTDHVFFVTDSGFAPEAAELVKRFGAENVLLFRIHRESYTFDGDSRSYVSLKEFDVEEHDINNLDGKLDVSTEEVKTIIDKFIEKGSDNG